MFKNKSILCYGFMLINATWQHNSTDTKTMKEKLCPARQIRTEIGLLFQTLDEMEIRYDWERSTAYRGYAHV